jgi:acetyl esterase/lipase
MLCAGAIAGENGDSLYVNSLIDWRHTPKPIPGPERGLECWPYFQDVPYYDPLASPAFSATSTLKSFPPTLILTSSRDAQLSNALITHRRLVNAGIDAELHVWEGLGHGFFAQPWSNIVDPNIPEVREAWQQTVKFFKSRLGKTS